ncbi:MAG: PAS domain S-box protein [Bacteroidetes bacterium]|nr:PAS domain S-box protein [Bacteroidota bacterium]
MIDFLCCTLYLTPVRTLSVQAIPYPLQLVLFTVAIAGIHGIGMSLAYTGTGLTQVWSPSGLTILLLFLMGRHIVPAVLAGTAVSFLIFLPSVPAALLLACVASLEALLGAFLLRRSEFDPGLRSLRDVGRLIVMSGAVSTAAGALLGSVIHSLLVVPDEPFQPLNILLWWMGNLVGVIVLTPALCLLTAPWTGQWGRRRVAEFALLMIAAGILSAVVFNGAAVTSGFTFHVVFILFPLAVIASVRFGIIGAVSAVFVIALNAVLSVATGAGLFAADSYAASILLVDLFVLMLGATALSLASLAEERNSADQTVRNSEERYRLVTERTGQLVYDYDIATGSILWGGAVHEVTLYGPEEFRTIGVDQWLEHVHPDDRSGAEEQMNRAMRERTELRMEYRFRRKDGSYVDVLDRGTYLYRSNGAAEAYRLLGTMADITLQNTIFRRLRESEERFRVLIEKSADGIMLMDKRGMIIFVSPSAERIIGYTPEELLGTSIFTILHPSEAKRYTYRFGRLTVEYERSQHLFGRFRHRSGAWVHIEGMVTNLFNNPGVNAFVANFRDVTGRIEAEDRLRRSLQEKEILLKEVHHRVKNNMQVISSLLNLQTASRTETEAVAMVRESRDRVKSMALIHEILYQSDDLASVDFAAYIRQLTASLQRSFGPRAASVTITVKVGRVLLGMDEAVPCGLIINELVSNALKYAFPRGRSGTITVSMKQLRSSTVRLSVSDTGTGMPAKRPAGGSLGLRIVRALTEQLHGTIDTGPGPGTVVTIEFPNHRHAAV